MEKRVIIRIYIGVIWLTIALISLTITKMALYEDIKYLFWAVSVLNPLLFLLYVKGVPQQPSKEERREIYLLAFSFICLILTFFAAILIGH